MNGLIALATVIGTLGVSAYLWILGVTRAEARGEHAGYWRCWKLHNSDGSWRR